MNDELNRHLDGEMTSEGLEPEDRTVADEWDRMLAAFRTSAPSGRAPAWLEQNVMAEIEALPERSGFTRLLEWVLQPRVVRVTPLSAGLVTAALAALLLIPGRATTPEPNGTPDPVEAVVYVQFILDAPTATSVAVAGDFSEWEPEFTLEDADGDGVWTGRVPVEPGVHSYMFLIDGTEWETDPRADRYQDDGFGNQNAVLAVAAGV